MKSTSEKRRDLNLYLSERNRKGKVGGGRYADRKGKKEGKGNLLVGPKNRRHRRRDEQQQQQLLLHCHIKIPISKVDKFPALELNQK